MVKNVWGEKVREDTDDLWYTPKKDRLKEDDPSDPKANALDEVTGDDLDGWSPADGEPE